MAQQSPTARHLSGTMRKIPCPRCGTINLEKFVTFPHCANCGILLPAQSTSAQLQRAAPRLIKPLLGMAVLAGATLCLVVAAALFEATPQDSGQIVIYGQLSRAARVGDLVSAQFTVDTMDAPASQMNNTLSEVKVRVPREFFDAFDSVALDPAPDEVTGRGSGRYFLCYAAARNAVATHGTRAAARSPPFKHANLCSRSWHG